MALVGGLVGTVIEKTGVVGKIGGLFGGGKEPNAGSSSFVDAIDNYEKISTAKARSMVDEFTNRIARGDSDYQLAEYVATQGGEPGRGSAYRSSWKWEILQDWINKTRALVNDPRRNNAPAPVAGGDPSRRNNSPAFMTGLSFKNPMVYLFGASLSIVGFYVFKNLK